MKLHREWLMQDLQRLPEDKFAIRQMASEIETLELEYKAIKATNYDKLPAAPSGNSTQEKLENNIAKRDELRASLKATRRHVADMERLLSQLNNPDRTIIEKTYIYEHHTTEQIAEEIGLSVRQTLNRKRDAVDKLLHLRFGQGYRP